MKRFLSIIFLFLSCSPIDIDHNISLENQKFIVDNDNRILIFHGLCGPNSSKHSDGCQPWQTPKDWARMSNEWGFNFVRDMWFLSELYPTRYTINNTYLANNIKRAKVFDSLGIYFVVDVHQDLFNDRFCGNGFPDWMVDTTIPFTCKEPWNLNYTQPAVLVNYDSFWKSEQKRHDYIRMLSSIWSAIDTFEHCLGVDVMNEPFIGITKNFEKKVLSTFYQDIEKMRVSHKFRTKMWYEPWMFTSSGIPTYLNVKFPNSVYFPHYYDPVVHEGQPYLYLNYLGMTKSIEIKTIEAEKFNSPIMYGEWGVSPKVDNYLKYVTDFCIRCDTMRIGWCFYTYDKTSGSEFAVVDENLKLQPVLGRLVRAYPQKIAGTNPIWSTTQFKFKLEYIPNDSKEPTIIFLPTTYTVKNINTRYELDSKTLKVYNDSIKSLVIIECITK